MTEFMRVTYVGNKEVKRDTLAKTNIVWNGHGSTRVVPESVAQILLNHPSVWVLERDFLSSAEPEAKPSAFIKMPNEEDLAPNLSPSEENPGLSQINSAAISAVLKSSQEAEFSSEEISNEIESDTEKENYSQGEKLSEDEKKSLIINAVKQLNPHNSDHFTANQSPRVQAVREIIGSDIELSTAEVRDVWSGYQLTLKENSIVGK